jgi:hypothetical protein
MHHLYGSLRIRCPLVATCEDFLPYLWYVISRGTSLSMSLSPFNMQIDGQFLGKKSSNLAGLMTKLCLRTTFCPLLSLVLQRFLLLQSF